MTILQKLTLIQKTKRKVIKIKKEITILFLSLISLFLENLGIWVNNAVIQKLLALCIITGLYIFIRRYRKKIITIVYLITIAIILLAQSFTPILLPLSVAILLSTSVINKKERINYFLLGILGILMVCSIVNYSLSNIPSLWYFFNNISYLLTKFLNFGTPIGLSLSGLSSFFVSCLTILFFCWFSRSLRSLLKYVVTSIVIYFITLNVVTVLLIKQPLWALNCLFIYPFAQFIILSILVNKHGVLLKDTLKFQKNKKMTFILVLMCFTILFIGIIPIPIFSQDSNKNITLINQGLMVDFDGKMSKEPPYGIMMSGTTFGITPSYLNTYGFNVSIVNKLDEIEWETTDTLIFVNFNRKIDSRFKEELKKFVENGGNVFILGDHTNLENLMTVTNDILNWSGLSLKDDTADPILLKRGQHWKNGLNFYNHPILFGLPMEQSEVQIWGGASIDINHYFSTFPLVTGKFGFSDNPNPSVEGRLGNRRVEKGEIVGDVILCAIEEYGKGKILMMGDTSTLQLNALPTCKSFVSRLLWYLNSESYISLKMFVVLKLCLFIGFLIIIFILIMKKNSKITILPFFILLAVIITITANSIITANFEKRVESLMNYNDVAAIDTSLGGYFHTSLLHETSYSILGFCNTLQRAGLVPIISNNWEENLKSQALFIVAPTKSITDSKIRQLDRYVIEGGTLFLFAGGERKQLINNLLTNFGLEIAPIFLGPVPWKNPMIPETLDASGPEFKEAYAIRVTDPKISLPYYVYDYQEEAYILISVSEKGKGKFVFIADSRYPLGENIEGEFSGHTENVKFLLKLLEETLQNSAEE